MIGKKRYEINRNLYSSIRKRYSPVPQDETEKIFDSIQAFFSFAQEPGKTLKSILDQAARTIYRSFNFKEISIIIKSEKDGLYRYASTLGFKKEAEEAQWRMAYTYEEIMDTDRYPTIKLGKFVAFCIEDGTTLEEDEIKTFNRPILLPDERKSDEDFLECDYFCIYIPGYREEILGFIEFGAPSDGKFPKRSKIKWIELMSSTLGFIIQRERIRKNTNR